MPYVHRPVSRRYCSPAVTVHGQRVHAGMVETPDHHRSKGGSKSGRSSINSTIGVTLIISILTPFPATVK